MRLFCKNCENIIRLNNGEELKCTCGSTNLRDCRNFRLNDGTKIIDTDGKDITEEAIDNISDIIENCTHRAYMDGVSACFKNVARVIKDMTDGLIAYRDKHPSANTSGDVIYTKQININIPPKKGTEQDETIL